MDDISYSNIYPTCCARDDTCISSNKTFSPAISRSDSGALTVVSSGSLLESSSFKHPEMPRIKSAKLLSINTEIAKPSSFVVDETKFGFRFVVKDNINLKDFLETYSKERSLVVKCWKAFKCFLRSSKVEHAPAQDHSTAKSATINCFHSLSPSNFDVKAQSSNVDLMKKQQQTKILSLFNPNALLGCQIMLFTEQFVLIGVAVVVDMKLDWVGYPTYKISAPDIMDTWVFLKRQYSDKNGIDFEVTRKVTDKFQN